MTYTVSAIIDPTATGSVLNTATVTAPAGISDPNPGNNSATDSTALRSGIGRCGSDADLVACYELDEGNGSVFLDGSLNTVYNDGTTVNAPTWVTGKYDIGLNFNRTNQYGSTPDETSLDIANQITLAAWI